MPATKTIMFNQSNTGPGASYNLPPDYANRGYIVEVGGVAAAVTASVDIEVSNNGTGWAKRMSFQNIAGTATLTIPVTNTDVDPNGPFPQVRANVISVTGGGLVTVSVTAAQTGLGAS